MIRVERRIGYEEAEDYSQCLLVLLIVPITVSVIYVNFILDKVTLDDYEFAINYDSMTNENLKKSDIKNIALFGIDY